MEFGKEFLNILFLLQVIYIVPIGIVCLLIVALQQASSYTPQSWERGINIMVCVHVVILYVVFRKRERLRVQNLEDTRRQFQIEDLFRLETEFVEQLRSQGIELEDSTLDSSCV
ncbi:uncharacterized protein LOC6733215 isoform X2 [Drosophila simulans]|uniref:uncharacterized protein LOC6733215 isoform X2 n=1 Tax=Drosophila simulans TaxID=7240 RepID=UPI001D110C09|nr:uncharacterized protein LOC6733215 isoform X2 [Drosophila simulans]